MYQKQKDILKIILTIIIIIIILVLLALWAYYEKKARDKTYDIKKMTGPYDNKSILFGLVFGFAFGLVNSIILFIGLNIFGSFVQDNVLKSHIGNIFSNTISIFFIQFITILVVSIAALDLNNTPIWAQGLGLLIGSIFGAVVGYYIRKSKNRYQ